MTTQTITGPGELQLNTAPGELVALAFLSVSGEIEYAAYDSADSTIVQGFAGTYNPETQQVTGAIQGNGFAAGVVTQPGDIVIARGFAAGLFLVLTGAPCTVIVTTN
jgi:hypothetical protein